MFAFVAGFLLSPVLIGQAPDPGPTPASGFVMYEINGSAVPIKGRLDGGTLAWRIDDQAWTPTAPFAGPCDGVPATAKTRYRIAINGAPCEAVGYLDGSGAFRWCWSDQSGRLPARPAVAAVNPMGALANGVQSGPLDPVGTVRASDPETRAEAAAVMGEAGNCDPDVDPFPGPPAGLDWRPIAVGVVLGGLAVAFLGAFGLVFHHLSGGGRRGL